MLSRFLSIFVVGAALAAPVAAEMPKEITFGIISTDSSVALRERWQPVIDDMSKRVGVKVTPFFATDYAGVIEAMRFKKVDLAWFGNKSAIEAVDRANGEVFVQTIAPDGAVTILCSLRIATAASRHSMTCSSAARKSTSALAIPTRRQDSPFRATTYSP